MSKPTRVLTWIFVALGAVAAVAVLFHEPLLAAFNANPAFNGLILAVFAVGILVNLRQVARLHRCAGSGGRFGFSIDLAAQHMLAIELQPVEAMARKAAQLRVENCLGEVGGVCSCRSCTRQGVEDKFAGGFRFKPNLFGGHDDLKRVVWEPR